MLRATTVILLAALLVNSPAFAGDFGIYPLKLVLTSTSNISTVAVTNNAPEVVTVQISAKLWTQNENGQDVYTDTKDVLFFPKIVEINSGTKKLIRVGYQGEKIGTLEKTYRLFVEELPLAAAGRTAVKMVLSLHIPLFVGNTNEKPQGQLENIRVNQGIVSFDVRNTGTKHLKIDRIQLNGIDASGKEIFTVNKNGWY